MSRNFLEQQIKERVQHWGHLLAVADYDGAFESTYHPPGDHWTPELLQRVIENYGRVDPRYTKYQVTRMPSQEELDRIEITWFEEGPKLGYVGYDLPLNGEWSDVTAVLDILPPEDKPLLELVSVRVM